MNTETGSETHWTELPPLPEAIAGQCVGVAGGRLVVAGGSLWTAPPWNKGVKMWSDRIYGLEPGSDHWQLLGHLPVPMGYSAAVQIGDSFLCIGGQSATQVFSSTLKISFEGLSLQIKELNPLPKPLTNAAAGFADGYIFVVGGQHSLEPKDVSPDVYSIDFATPGKWEEVHSGPWKHSRILPAVSGCEDRIYVAGGADLGSAQDGTAQREYLRDVWSFSTQSKEWQRLPDLPAAVTAAPSTCSADGDWLIFGGDDGRLAGQIQTLKDAHPGFRKSILRWDWHSFQWIEVAVMPVSLVTTGVTRWGNYYVIAGGENQPGHRSTRVIALQLRQEMTLPGAGPSEHANLSTAPRD